MRYRSLAILVTALSSVPFAAVHAQSVYVAPGGVYIGGGPVYVTPAPNVAAPYAPYTAPTYYGGTGPVVVAPAPTYEGPAVAPVYETEGPYVAPYDTYGPRPGLVQRGYIYQQGDYAARVAPRPPAPIANRNGRCFYNGRWEYCR
jgi:hypothetical protein